MNIVHASDMHDNIHNKDNLVYSFKVCYMYDVIIVGGASAGLAAAIYTSRQGLNSSPYKGY